MKYLNVMAGICLLGVVACAPKQVSVKGVISDATMNTLAIVTQSGDTLQFSTLNAERDTPNGILLEDTATVYYNGSYTKGMSATKIAVSSRDQTLLGGDRDEHGCIGSAGYVWCEVLKDCIRVFEKGIRTEDVDGSNASTFIVFSPDSAQVELFFSNGNPNEILDRRSLPSGGSAWNVEDDDTKNVRIENGLWTISQRGKLIFSQKKDERK
ncbi:hypothetical protein [Bacteroides sp.]|uniref:hypothetical protein n=1 Tax=Bacteroides sp. TaxID=29523 RepID=UPI00262660C8|nr:hypothetical protein [Bacteroides sp.]MDD3037807.1 hypothetical protein [Bacteroides sp.]